MTEFSTLIEQTRTFATQHGPSEMLTQTVPLAILLLVGGCGMSVLGAKLSRVAATLGFAIAGGAGGYYFSLSSGYPVPVCIGAGALLFGVIGHQTLRFWVGVLTAGVLTAVSLGVFGYQRVAPYIAEFEQEQTITSQDGSFTFTVPTPEEQAAYRQRDPGVWAREFWDYAKQRDPALQQSARTIGIITVLTGLCLGVVAMRWALIISTAMLGTGLVTAGVATLIAHYWPEQGYQALEARPAVFGAVVGGFLVSSLIVQTALTKPAAESKGESSRKK
jgi:hypothetical protein